MQSAPNRTSWETSPIVRQLRTRHKSATSLILPDMDSYKICNNHIFRCEPCNETEIAQCWHQKTWKEIPHKCTCPYINEESISRNGTAICDLILRLMHSREHSSRHQSSWKDHGSRSDQKAPSKSCKCIAQDLSRNGKEDLVENWDILLIELVLLDDDLRSLVSIVNPTMRETSHISGKGETERDIARYKHASMFLFIPLPVSKPEPEVSLP